MKYYIKDSTLKDSPVKLFESTGQTISYLKTAVIIVNYNSGTYLKECLDAMEHQTRVPERLIVVDNASSTIDYRFRGKDLRRHIGDFLSDGAKLTDRGVKLLSFIGIFDTMLKSLFRTAQNTCAKL